MTAEEDRAKEFGMRQVRARLLKLNGLLGVNSDDSDDEVAPAPGPAKPAPIETKQVQPIVASSNPPPRKSGKRESKWGKTNSN